MLVYDLCRSDGRIRVWINRRLHEIGALKLQHSVWELKNPEHLRPLVKRIKAAGGKAMVLEKRVVCG